MPVVAVGVGPGSLELVAPAAQAVLERADVVIGYGPYLEPFGALLDGRWVETTGMRRELDRCRRALELSGEGMLVAVVSGGDAGVYGMAGLLMEIDPHADIEVVPGITACQAAAARLGAPLMNDFAVLSLSDLLTPREEVLRRVRAVGAADLVTCLYNPSSRRRRPLFQEALRIFLEARSPDTPAGWVRDAYRPEETVGLTSLGRLQKAPVDMRTIVILGSSRTEILGKRLVTPRGYKAKYGAGE